MRRHGKHVILGPVLSEAQRDIRASGLYSVLTKAVPLLPVAFNWSGMTRYLRLGKHVTTYHHKILPTQYIWRF